MGGIGGSGGGMNYKNSLRPQSAQEKTAPVATPAVAPAGGKKDTDIRISAIEENNQLMVMATAYEWDNIQSAIRKLDVIPLQVQIEVRILEVSLTGDLNLGVQWYLAGLIGTAPGSAQANGQYSYPEFTGNSHDRHRASLGATKNGATPSLGGFFYSFLNKNFEVAINALETSGVAKTLSAPSLVVANNQEASINVGQQIPVVQTYYNGLGVTGAGTNGVGTGLGTTGSVQYLNTGVQLSVTPRVNPGGLVYLDVQQEVSNPGTPSTNGGNPPINQRQIQTQVAVQSGETVLLGGLISENKGDSAQSLPGIARIPILRNLFGSTTTHRDRTELIVLITPRVVSSVDETRQMTADYARQFESLIPLRKNQTAPINPASLTPPAPVETYPAPENQKSQEDLPRDH